MRSKLWSGLVSALAALGLCLGIAATAGDALAVGITLPFTVELESGLTANYGTVEIEEVGAGDLAFTITLDTSVLGSSARLREFYFNLAGDFDDDDDDRHDQGWHGSHPWKSSWNDDPQKSKQRHRDDDDDDDDDRHNRHRDDDDDDDDDDRDGDLRVSGIRCNGGACDNDFDLEAGATARGGDGARFDFMLDFGHDNGILQIVSFILSADSDLSLADVLADASSTEEGIEVLFAAYVKGVGEDGDATATIGAIPEPATALLLGLGLVGLAVGGSRAGHRP
jgi:hypothetical protein